MSKICFHCGAANDKDAELCAVCGQVLTSLPKDYEIHSPKAELNIPVGKWVKLG